MTISQAVWGEWCAVGMAGARLGTPGRKAGSGPTPTPRRRVSGLSVLAPPLVSILLQHSRDALFQVDLQLPRPDPGPWQEGRQPARLLRLCK